MCEPSQVIVTAATAAGQRCRARGRLSCHGVKTLRPGGDVTPLQPSVKSQQEGTLTFITFPAKWAQRLARCLFICTGPPEPLYFSARFLLPAVCTCSFLVLFSIAQFLNLKGRRRHLQRAVWVREACCALGSTADLVVLTRPGNRTSSVGRNRVHVGASAAFPRVDG